MAEQHIAGSRIGNGKPGTKVAILKPLADPAARIAALRSGAVNTLVGRDGEVWGHNTDVDGIRAVWSSVPLPTDRPVLILGTGEEIEVAEVEQAISAQPVTGDTGAPVLPYDLPLREAREKFEHDYLLHQLAEVGGSVGKLADAVGMERTHLYRKLRALGVDPKAVAADRNRK